MTEILTTPEKFKIDKNNYRLIKLPNGLKVLLVQHPTGDSSESSRKLAALCLYLDVGAYNDPPEAKGMSHLLEHMAFMGSERYPKENEYHQFISNNGGDLNAMTGFLETIFFFTVVEQQLEGALDRFSSIFVAPLILESAIERELESVESEYQSRKNSDFLRQRMMIYTLAKSDNPANVFVPGNTATFRANDRTNSQLYDMLHEHHRKFYVANRMSLGIQSSLELNELQNLVEKYFTDIKSGEARPEAAESTHENIFDEEIYKKVIYIKPKTEKMNLSLFLPLPAATEYYKTKPIEYLSQLLEDEFDGGLCSFLRRKSLITSFSAQNPRSFGMRPLISALYIDIGLTEYGSTRIDEILSAFYSYLLLIKESPIERHKEIFNELKGFGDKEAEFKETPEAQENVLKACLSLRSTADEHILKSGTNFFIEYDEETLIKYINLINEPNYNITIMNSNLDIDYNEIERSEIEYRRDDMPENFTKAWTERNLISELKLPPKNEFICSNFDIYAEKEGVEGSKYPEKIFEDVVAETWYKLDNTFKLPHTIVSIILTSPLNYASPFNVVLARLYVNILNRFLDEKYASAIKADLNFSLNLTAENDIKISFNGYNEKLPLLVDMVTKALRCFNEYLDDSVFDIYKKQRRDNITNSLKQGTFSSTLSDHFTNVNYPHVYEYYSEIDKISVEDLEKFVDKFFNKLRVQMFVCGNLSKDEALMISSNILANIGVNPVTDLSTITQKSLKIPEGRTSIKIKSFQDNDKNSFVVEFFDLGQRSLRTDCLNDMMTQIFEEPVFDTLRTKEQLAYSVRVANENTKDSLSMVLYIKCQEDKHPARSVASRLLKFVKEDMKKILDDLSDEHFEKIRESKVNSMLIPFSDFQEEQRFYWREIIDLSYRFDRKEKKAEMFGKISKQDIINFYNEMFVAKPHRNLSIQLIGDGNANQAEENDNDGDDDMKLTLIDTKFDDEDIVITDLEEFKRGLEIYPSFKTTYNYD